MNETQRTDILLKGAIVDDARLSASSREVLRDALPKRLQGDRVNAFLQDISNALFHCENDLAPEKPSLVRDSGAHVSDAVDQLLTALTEIRSNQTLLGGLDVQFLRHVHRVDRDSVNSGTSADVFLNKLAIDLDTLREVAKSWSENANTDPHNQPSKSHAYEIACCTAIAWRTHFNEEPTANRNEQSTAFTKFLATLANRAPLASPKPYLYPDKGFVIGALIAQKAIDHTKNAMNGVTIPEGQSLK